LQTERIDLYIIHYYDPVTAIDETLRALDDLVSQGKVLYLGVSNWAAWQIAKALGISEQKGFARLECIEPMYNLVKRQAEIELLPLAKSEHLGVIPYNPLGAGLFTGKYSRDKKPASGRIVEKEVYTKRYSDPQYFEIAEQFTHFARELGVSPVTLALSWVKSHPAVTAPIFGARNAEQLGDSLAAANFDMTSEIREKITKLSISPGTATDRLEEELDSKYQFRKR
jgi:aryl-alcohol dehydrogenase-like predicted oxidoreductase